MTRVNWLVTFSLIIAFGVSGFYNLRHKYKEQKIAKIGCLTAIIILVKHEKLSSTHEAVQAYDIICSYVGTHYLDDIKDLP